MACDWRKRIETFKPLPSKIDTIGSSKHLRVAVAVLFDIDLVASGDNRLALQLSQRSPRWALLETRHPEGLVDVSRQRSLVERKLIKSR